MKELTVLTVSYKTPGYIFQLLNTFEKFKPSGLKVEYIIVENSNLNYKEELNNISPNICFLNNESKETGSHANASGIEFGKPFVKTEYCFVCHSDIMVASKSFFDYIFSKISKGYEIIGTGLDNARINALHISGILMKSNLLKNINTYPVKKNGNMILDVGDSITQYARDNNTPYICMDNTINNKELCDSINEPYNTWDCDCGIARAVDDCGNVIFLHLGRGTPKHHGYYGKPNKKTSLDWLKIHKDLDG